MRRKIFVLLALLPILSVAQDFSFSISKRSDCGSLTTNLINESADTSKYTFEWVWNGTVQSVFTTDVTANFELPGIYPISMVVKDLGGAEIESITDTVTVFRRPSAVISSDVNATCYQEPVQFSIESIDSEAEIDTYRWIYGDGGIDFDASPIPHSYSTPGTYLATLIVTDTHGCKSDQSNAVTVSISNKKPRAEFTVNQNFACVPELSAEFSNTSIATEGAIDRYEWSFGDNTSSSEIEPTHSFIGFGSYQVELKVYQDNGCTDTETLNIELSEFSVGIEAFDAIKPSANLMDGSGMEACAGEVKFYSTGPYASEYRWDVGNDGSIEQENLSILTYDFSEPGKYPISLYAKNNTGCEDTLVDTLVVAALFEFTQLPDTVFSCNSAADLDFTVALSSEFDSIVWLLDSTQLIGQNSLTISMNQPEGIYGIYIYAESKNACPSWVMLDSIAEVEVPQAYIAEVSPQSGCVPLQANLTGIYFYDPVLGKDSIVSVKWDYEGDGTIDVTDAWSVSNEYGTTGQFTPSISVTTALGCTAMSYGSVFVGNKTAVDFSIDQELCTWQDAEVLQLTDLLPESPNDSAWYRVYSSEDPLRIANDTAPVSPVGMGIAVHFDDTVGYFNMSMMVSDHGCRSDWLVRDSVILVKGPIVSAEKSMDCSAPYDFTFTANQLIAYDSISWQLFRYDSLFPYQNPENAMPIYQQIGGNTDNVAEWQYNFETVGRGDYRLSAIANSDMYPECADTTVIEWVPVRDLVVDFKLTDTVVCKGEMLLFDNTAETAAQDMFATHVWIADTLGTEPVAVKSIENLKPIEYKGIEVETYDEKGIAEVWLYGRDHNSCLDSSVQLVKVYQPRALFAIDTPSNCLPYIVGLKDSSVFDTTIVERIWMTEGDTASFDTGNKTTVQDWISTAGAKSPSLTIKNVLGCEDTYSIPSGIFPIIPDSRFVVNEPKLCTKGDVTVSLAGLADSNYSAPVDSIRWFRNGTFKLTTLAGKLPNLFNADGLDSISAVAYLQSPVGSTCSDKTTIAVEPIDMKLRLPIDSTNLCANTGTEAILSIGDSVYDGLNDVTAIKWYVNNTYRPTQFYAQNLRLGPEGEYWLRMEVETDYAGCEKLVDSALIFVRSKSVSIELSKSEVCVGEEFTMQLTNADFMQTVPHYWIAGDKRRIDGTQSSVNYTYEKLPDVQTVDVTFKVEGESELVDESCSDISVTKTMKIHPFAASFTRGSADTDTIGCVPFTVSFKNTSVGDNSYTWTIGADTESSADIEYEFEEPGKEYSVKLQISNSTCTHAMEKLVYTYPDPGLSIAVSDTVVCDYDEVQLQANGNYSKFESWEWHGVEAESTSPVIFTTFDSTAMVRATVLSEYNCSVSDSVKIISQYSPYYTGAPINELLYYFSADSVKTLEGEKSGILIVNEVFNVLNDSLNGVTYRWQPADYLSCSNCFSPDIDLSCGQDLDCNSIPESIIYKVLMTDSLQCYVDVEEELDFKILKESRLGVPAAFTPNGDGLNDVIYPRGWAYSEFVEMAIYNRWGQQLFYSNNENEGWDGTFNGEAQLAGTYSYTLKAIDSFNESIMVKGFITLIR